MSTVFMIISFVAIVAEYICIGSAISAACHDAKVFRAEYDTEPYWFEFMGYVMDYNGRVLSSVLLSLVAITFILLDCIC